MNVCAIRRGDAGDIKRGDAAADWCQPQEAPARPGGDPTLIVGAGVGADVDVGAIRRRGARYLQGLATLNANDPVGVVSEMSERPALVVAAAIGPLNDIGTVRRVM